MRPKDQAKTHVTDDQSEVLRLLGDAATYGHGVRKVERIDTHGAIVFLAGSKAYKIKRAVAYPYMDFSTLEKRQESCRRELAINSRTAADLYLDVVPVTRERSGLTLDGAGEAVEWVLVMRRFDQSDLLSERAAAGTLTPETMVALADAVARFHAAAEERRDGGAGTDAVSWVVRENAEEFEERSDLFNIGESQRLTEDALAELERNAKLLDDRAENGEVRLCHGDLHLRNVVLLDGRPTLFDAIEFNDAIARIDVFYDLAFLLMDLDQRGLRTFANLVLNRYLQQRDELAALPLLPLFLSMRAAVRAKVAASLEAVAERDADKAKHRDEAAAYFQRAQAYLRPPPPCLVAVGGLSGSGKTTLARSLAPEIGAAPGAVHLRSDLLRKELAGVAELHALPPSAYDAASSRAVYAEMARRAARALSAGHSVVADAVFARPDERAAVEAVAQQAGCRFAGLWLEADLTVLSTRVQTRRNDASDADAEVVRRQADYDLGDVSWQRLPADGSAPKLRANALAYLKKIF